MERREASTVGGNVNWYSRYGEQYRDFLKTKREVSYDFEILLLGIYPEKSMIWVATCTPTFIAALFTIATIWKQPKCSLREEWIKKIWSVFTMEYYSTTSKNQILPFVATWMELESVIVNEVRQRRRNNIWHLLFVEFKMKLYNKLTKQKHKHELMFARGQDGRKGLLGSLGWACTHYCN